jgi:hypothetical protein
VWGTFTKCCVLYVEVVQSIGAPLDAGFRELRHGTRFEDDDSMIHAVRT